MTASERRAHPRRALQRGAFCYVDGSRLDGTSVDVSAGGVYLRTTDQRDVPEGTSVALVFTNPEHATRPVILFGRVARRQGGPSEGFGVRWEKAVTEGSKAELAAFLADLLDIRAATITAQPVAGSTDGRRVFVFPVASPPSPSSRPTPPRPRSGFRDRTEAKAWRRGPEHGAVTQMVARQDLGVRVSMAATLTLADITTPVTITHLGLFGLSVEAPALQLAPGTLVLVRLEIASRSGALPITCECRALRPIPGEPEAARGVPLEILRLDEGAHTGVLVRYVKWLHIHTFSGA